MEFVDPSRVFFKKKKFWLWRIPHLGQCSTGGHRAAQSRSEAAAPVHTTTTVQAYGQLKKTNPDKEAENLPPLFLWVAEEERWGRRKKGLPTFISSFSLPFPSFPSLQLGGGRSAIVREKGGFLFLPSFFACAGH